MFFRIFVLSLKKPHKNLSNRLSCGHTNKESIITDNFRLQQFLLNQFFQLFSSHRAELLFARGIERTKQEETNISNPTDIKLILCVKE